MPRTFHGPVTDLVPHRASMLLIDHLLEDAPEYVRVGATVRREQIFCTDDGLPGWVGVELMAQCVACWAGLRRLERKQQVQLGFLLGTRRYEIQAPFIRVGARLEIDATQEIVSEQGLAVFVCRIFHDGAVIATGSLNVFSPDNVDDYIKEALSA
ncbi:MAG: hypothetical protein ACO1OB_17680 [Archangium sp.]